jgi:class 3 adenylate cyclase
MLRVRISNRQERKQLEHRDGPLEFGRGPLRDGVARCIVQDACVSRDHLRIQELESGRVRIENLSRRNPVLLSDNSGIGPGETGVFDLPLRLVIGETRVSIEPAESKIGSPELFDKATLETAEIRIPSAFERKSFVPVAQVAEVAEVAQVEKESESDPLGVQIEQFFPPSIASEVLRNPGLLAGQEREVTVLFCGIRGFARLSERLGPGDTCRLVADVMDQLADRIREYDGVVVDLAGDGLRAMWNAPADQAEHAVLACRAAVSILAQAPELSNPWSSLLGGPLNLGIGLNTGAALVGNFGSPRQLKYAPLGRTANLAGCVQQAATRLAMPALITQSTYELVRDVVAARRLGFYRLTGINEPINLYELPVENAEAELTPELAQNVAEWLARRDRYEEALARFEAGKWANACQLLYPLLNEREPDIACLELLARALVCLKNPPERFEPVMELGK